MYSFEYVLQSDEELRKAISVKRIYDVIDDKKRGGGDDRVPVLSPKDIEKESKNMRENSVIASVRDLQIEVVLLKKIGHEKITIDKSGECRAARKKVCFFSEKSEMEVTLFEII